MKHWLAPFYAPVAWGVVLYLSGAFIGWELNPGKWSPDARFLAVALWLSGALPLIGLRAESSKRR